MRKYIPRWKLMTSGQAMDQTRLLWYIVAAGYTVVFGACGCCLLAELHLHRFAALGDLCSRARGRRPSTYRMRVQQPPIRDAQESPTAYPNVADKLGGVAVSRLWMPRHMYELAHTCTVSTSFSHETMDAGWEGVRVASIAVRCSSSCTRHMVCC